jgi:hypothetical protein
MGIEVLLRSAEGSTPERAKAVAGGLGLTQVFELVHAPSGSVRLEFAQSPKKTVTLTFNDDGTIHAVWLGRPRDTPEAETALIGLLLPGATVIGSNPAYDPADLEEDRAEGL